MSIADEITRLQTAKADIKTAINTKGGSLTTETISSYATAINNLPSGDLTIEGQQIITGILSGTVDEFDTVYSKIIGGGSNWDTVHNKLSNPADLPTGNGYDVSFSSDDTYLAVAHWVSPNLTVYKRSGDTFTKLSDPADLPTGNGRGVSFSSDDTYLAVAYWASPFLTVYKRSGDTFTKLSNPTDLPAGASTSVSFSNNDTYLAVTCQPSPYLTVYKRSGDVFTKLSGITAPTGAGNGVSFSSDDTYLAVGHGVSQFLTVYKRSGDVFTKLSGIAAPPVSQYGSGKGVSFSSDDTYLAVGHDGTPFFTMYKTTLINPTTLISPALNTIPLGYQDLGYALESGVEDDEIDMVSIFR